MYTIVQIDDFVRWLDRLRDGPARIRLVRRLRRASLGNLGDVKFVGQQVWEMREHFGPGWRMYYTERKGALIFLLCGGDKSSQEADITRAQQLAKEI
jgi:putative addiction module killer protein